MTRFHITINRNIVKSYITFGDAHKGILERMKADYPDVRPTTILKDGTHYRIGDRDYRIERGKKVGS